MKIVHVAESFAGGVLDFVADLTRGFPDFSHVVIHGRRPDTPGSFVERFAPGTTFLPWRHAGREIRPVRDLLALRELIALLGTQRDAGAVHLHSSKAGFLGRLACRRLGLQGRTLYSPHGAAFLRKDISRAKAAFYRLLEQAADRCGGRVLGTCASEAAAFAAAGIPAACISTGIACADGPARPLRRQALVVGTAGRIARQKNPLLFNEIAREFLSEPSVRFVWIGDGELRSQLSSSNIQVAGWLPKDGLRAQLAELDVYLSTALWEGMPLSALLALCAGRPLVLFDCVGNHDLVQDGDNGFLFTDKAAAVRHIRRLRDDKGLAETMGTASVRLARTRFSLANMLNQYRMLYGQLGGETPRTGTAA